MSTWDGNNYYYSGQGVCLVGPRSATGKPAGLLSIGNVSDLKLSIASTVLEHKESQSGARGIDLRLTTELKGTLSMTLENFIAENLALAVRGDLTEKLEGAASGESITGYLGKVQPLRYAQIDTLVLKRASQTLTAYVDDSTAYDYKVNEEAGSFLLNDGSVVALDKLTTGGTAPSAVTVGNPTVVTVANTAAVGDYAAFSGFAGADAGTLNGKAFKVVAASASSVSLNVDTTGLTITVGTPLSFFDGVALTAAYNYAGQNIVDALTLGSQERYMRFEGLNTADNDMPVVVEVFKFLVDPLRELALISDGIGQFVLEGNFLYDSLQTSGSKYFKETLLR